MKKIYGKRARMLSEDVLLLDSKICLDTNIQEENIQQIMSLKGRYENNNENNIINTSSWWDSYQTKGRRNMMCFLCHILPHNRESNDQTKELK